MTDYNGRGFYEEHPLLNKVWLSDVYSLSSSWQKRTIPESRSYYSRCADGNYHRLTGSKDGLPDSVQGIDIRNMLVLTERWNGSLPNRIFREDVIRLQEITDKSTKPNSLHELENICAHEKCEGFDAMIGEETNKGTARRMKRLESENKYYKNLSLKHQMMYIGAGAKIKELNAEIERLKQFEPIVVDPNNIKDKSDLTKRFATMDIM